MFDIDKVDRSVHLFVFDIFVAIAKIKQTSSKFTNSQDLLYSYTDWDSVIREFEIIGEASKYLLKSSLLENEYQVVVDFRNQISHEYFGIDRDIIWLIIQNDLKDFESAIIHLIENMENSEKAELVQAFIEDNTYLDFVVTALKSLKA